MDSSTSDYQYDGSTEIIQKSSLENPDLTVIVPVYNSERFLEECVTSLMEQTLNSIEFIFIDDASKDNSLHLLTNTLNRFPHRHSDVTILHHPTNRGVAFTRQEGITHSNGTWIIFCDSDDLVDKNAYDLMLKLADSNGCDVIACGLSTFGEVKTPIISSPGSGLMDSVYMLEGICGMRKKSIHGSLCNKMIRRSLFINVYFPKNLSYCEDEVAIFQVLSKSPKILCISTPLYKYRVHGLSLVRTKDKTMLNQVEILLEALRTLSENAEPYFIKALNVKATIYLYRLLKSELLDTEVLAERYKSYLPYLKANHKLNYLEKLHLTEALKNHPVKAYLIGKMNHFGYKIIKLIR